MRRSRALGIAFIAVAVAVGSECSRNGDSEQTLARIPLDSMEEVISRTGASVDPDVSVDGHGSIRIDVSDSMTVRIAEIETPSLENARLIYRAHIRSADLHGKAYLEMWCVFPVRGEFFSRALQSPLSGTNDWLTQETSFALQKGQVPSQVKLNLVVEGKGTVWVDDAELVKGPL